MSETSLRIVAWLLTYALHSTVLLCAAALLTARWVRGEALRETLWKAALVGGIATATVQQAGWIGDGGRLDVFALPVSATQAANVTPSSRASDEAAASTASDESAVSTASTASVPSTASTASAPSTASIASTASAVGATSRAPSRAGSPGMRPADESPATHLATPTAPSSRRPLVEWALLAWASGAMAMLARLAWRQLRVRALLRDRAAVVDNAVLAMLAELRRNAGIWRPVRLTVSAASPTPLALGGGEICVPPRFLTGLDPEQQRSALAHELAHLARRDPAWHVAVSVLEAVFFFQPLNRMARARLRESAEFLCDAWAARQTGSPLGLARCLAEVASWVAPGRHPVPAGTMAMAEGGSPLVQRVQRLTAWRGESDGSRAMRLAAAALLVGAVAAIAPAVASTDKPRPGQAARSPAAPAVVDQEGQEIVVIRHPDPSQPLARRWAWAVDEIARGRTERAWIAYSVPMRLAPDEAWITDSDDFAFSSFNMASLNGALGAPAEHALLLFTVNPAGDLKRVSGRRGVGMDLGGLPVVWLGAADAAGSFAQLRRLADEAHVTDQRETLVGMIGIHPGDEVVPYLAAVLGRDGSNGVRGEAAEALGLHPTAEALAALRTAVARDGSDDVRREAVEAVGRMGTDDATALLRTLATGGRDAGVRQEAAEALGRIPGAASLEALSTAAFGDRDPDVAREAVEAMAHFPAGMGGPVLVRIAWTHADSWVARQAAESLGRLPAPWSVVQLDSIARRHPDPDVAQQAVESLGDHPDAVSGGYLRQIARTHPAPRVREEALDQLRRGDRREGIDDATDHDEEDAGHADAIGEALRTVTEGRNGGTPGDPDPDVDPRADPDPDPNPDADADGP